MKRGKQIDTWYPFYIDKWLFGSTRHELIIKNPGQFMDLRGIWQDLLTLSKKDGGWIRANETTSYPHEQLAGMFCVPLEMLKKTIEICLSEQVKKMIEPSPGIYFIPSTEIYNLTDRWKREVSKYPLTSQKKEVYSKKQEVRGEKIKGEYIREEKRKEDRSVHTRAKKPRSGQPNIRLILDEKPKRWEGITEELKTLWAKTYPGCDIDVVLQEMIAYWDAQPKSKRKINWKAAIVNRLKWLQDHGGTRGNVTGGVREWLAEEKEKEKREKLSE